MKNQSGSAIIMLFIAVALFGALAYAFTQNNRGSISFIETEKDKAITTQSQSCSHAVSTATRRLQMRGCTSISSETDQALITDPSCAIYHVSGGGVKADCAPPPAPADICTTGAIGTACSSDGAIYIGIMNSQRIYAAPADEVNTAWKTVNSNNTGADSTTDGFSNTQAIVAAGAALHPAANLCYSKPPAGTWYLPAINELGLIWTNRADIDLAAKGFNTTGSWYWSSTQYSGNVNVALNRNFYNGNVNNTSFKTGAFKMRCVRR